jgi:hypothetical protein
MEGFDLTLGRGLKPGFDEAQACFRRRIGGVDYLHLRGRQNGDLYLTRHGWPCADCLLPERWFTGEQFRKPGQALAGATGAVYRVPTAHPARKGFALVVKFSRFGQDVGITVVDELIANRQFMARVDHAEFLPPFEEFANLERLRGQCRGLFATKAPLAIYSPPTRYLAWQLGRKNHLQWTYRRQLSAMTNRCSASWITNCWCRQTPHNPTHPIPCSTSHSSVLPARATSSRYSSDPVRSWSPASAPCAEEMRRAA